MTTSEFSNEFDILYNNIMSNQAPGLNEYEKSVLLTQAQESLILDIYTGRYNKSSFESTEEVTSYLNTLVKKTTITSNIEEEGLIKSSKIYKLPEDLWYITYESVTLEDKNLECKNNQTVLVKPVTQDELHSTLRNPFKRCNDKRVLRLIRDNKAELISDYNIKSYNISYISKPSPIILENLDVYNISINGVTNVTDCKLNPASHRLILNRAVQLAKSLWVSGNQINKSYV